MTTFDDVPKIGADKHPVTVTRTDGLVTVPEARAIITVPDRDTGIGRLLVWRTPDAPCLDTLWIRDRSTLGSGPWTLLATDGIAWTITNERGCGCSSPLKTMPLPWGSYRMGTLH